MQSIPVCEPAGATILSLFYEKSVEMYINCFIPIAFGAKNRGKTIASEVCVSVVGQRGKPVKDITDAELNKMLWAGLPFVYDDPSDIRQLKTILMNCFGGGILGSAKMTSSTRTVPIVCANDFIVQAIAQEEERYVYVRMYTYIHTRYHHSCIK